MVNKLVDGITRAIHHQFGQEYHIYTENKEQEMKEPCFFVSCVSPDDKRVLGNRYKLTNKFCIQYFPCSDEPKRECNTIRDALVMALEYIEVEKEGLVEGTQFSAEYTNDFLTVFVNYDFYVYRKTDKEQKMEELKMKGGLASGRQ